MIKTITIDDSKWRVVPIEPTKEMSNAAVFHYSSAEYTGFSSTYTAMVLAAPQPEPVESEPVAMVDHHYDGGINWHNGNDIKIKCGTALYTTPQPDRTAELEAALKVARETLIDLAEGTRHPARHNKALDKINEVLKP